MKFWRILEDGILTLGNKIMKVVEKYRRSIIKKKRKEFLRQSNMIKQI